LIINKTLSRTKVYKVYPQKEHSPFHTGKPVRRKHSKKSPELEKVQCKRLPTDLREITNNLTQSTIIYNLTLSPIFLSAKGFSILDVP